MSDEPSLEGLADGAMDTNKKAMSDGMEVMPVFLIYGPNGIGLYFMPEFANNRRAAIAMMKATIAQERADFYVFSMEAWVATQTEQFKPGDPPPSARPDRQEALVAIGASRDGKKASRFSMVRRDGGKVTFEDKHDFTGMIGILDGLFGNERAN